MNVKGVSKTPKGNFASFSRRWQQGRIRPHIKRPSNARRKLTGLNEGQKKSPPSIHLSTEPDRKTGNDFGRKSRAAGLGKIEPKKSLTTDVTGKVLVLRNQPPVSLQIAGSAFFPGRQNVL